VCPSFYLPGYYLLLFHDLTFISAFVHNLLVFGVLPWEDFFHWRLFLCPPSGRSDDLTALLSYTPCFLLDIVSPSGEL